MEIKIVSNQKLWDGWLKNNSRFSNFPQSWEWGEILLSEGKRIERLVVVENNETAAQAQVVYADLPLGMKYAFCPKGPVMNHESRIINQELTEKAWELLASYFKKQNCIFLRLEPQSPITLKAKSYQLKATPDINPAVTSVLDLRATEDNLWNNFQKKTRYGVRTAQAKNVKVTAEKNLETLMELLKLTSERSQFRLHSADHYRRVLSSENSYQFIAWAGRTPIATALFFGFGSTLTYLYAASDYQRHELLAPYFIQWEAIRLAKRLGFVYYDFFGIAPSVDHPPTPSFVRRGQSNLLPVDHPPTPSFIKSDQSNFLPLSEGGKNERERYQYDPHHRYAGITRFKLGFGGEIVSDSGTFDVVLSPMKRALYQAVRKLRKIL